MEKIIYVILFSVMKGILRAVVQMKKIKGKDQV